MLKEKSKTLVQQVTTSFNHSLDPVELYEKLTANSKRESALFISENSKNKDYELSLIALDMAIRVEYHHPIIEITALSKTGQDIMKHLLGYSQNEIKIEIKKDLRNEKKLSEDQRIKQPSPFDILRKILMLYKKDDDQPNCTKIILFTFSFELINFFENLPLIENNPTNFPDYIAYLPEKLIVIDHLKKQTHYSVIDSTLAKAKDKIASFIQKTKQPDNRKKKTIHKKILTKELAVSPCDDQFKKMVEACQEHILRGDIFQTVISRQFKTPCHYPLKAFKQLLQSTHCEYAFFFKSKNHVLLGASPETSVKIEKNVQNEQTVSLYPIAGTRPRGVNARGEFDRENDIREEAALRLSPKELAEHMMLVDLARNDIAKISIPGSTHVKILAEIKRYPNVMHMCSMIQGTLKPELDAFHAYTACMNMGTLSGAPKLKATKILRECEKVKRGPYGGAIGWINCDNQMDSAIIIRSALIYKKIAYIQAGAGIVADSFPSEETQETRYKAQVVLNAIMSEGG